MLGIMFAQIRPPTQKAPAKLRQYLDSFSTPSKSVHEVDDNPPDVYMNARTGEQLRTSVCVREGLILNHFENFKKSKVYKNISFEMKFKL